MNIATLCISTLLHPLSVLNNPSRPYRLLKRRALVPRQATSSRGPTSLWCAPEAYPAGPISKTRLLSLAPQAYIRWKRIC